MIYAIYLKYAKPYNFEFGDEDAMKNICHEIMIQIYTHYKQDQNKLKLAVILLEDLLDKNLTDLKIILNNIRKFFPDLPEFIIIFDQLN
jgi:hypothetical protein